MQKVITLNDLENIKLNLNKFEELDIKIEEAAKRFLKSMSDTNHELMKNNEISIGYNKVYQILKTKILKHSQIADYSCFYNKEIVQKIVDELVGTEKLQKMSIKILIIRDLLIKADALKNKMREKIEDNIYCEEAEELLDAIESLSVYNNISIICVRHKIEILENMLLKIEKVS